VPGLPACVRTGLSLPHRRASARRGSFVLVVLRENRLDHVVEGGERRVLLDVRIVRVHCRLCNTFAEMHPPFADPRRTYTHALARFVVDLCRVSTIQGAARIAGVSWDVAKDIEKRRLEQQYRCVPLKGVRYIAVDEIAVRRGHTYMTIVADLESGRVLHVAEGKDADALIPFLQRLKRSRARVKAVARLA